MVPGPRRHPFPLAPPPWLCSTQALMVTHAAARAETHRSEVIDEFLRDGAQGSPKISEMLRSRIPPRTERKGLSPRPLPVSVTSARKSSYRHDIICARRASGTGGEVTSLHHSLPPSSPPSLLSLLLHLLLPHSSMELGGQGSPWKGIVYGLGIVGSGKVSLDCSQILPASQDCK